MSDTEDYDRLIDEVDELVALARLVQKDQTADTNPPLRRRYLTWYATAKQLVPEEALPELKNMFTGGRFVKRIEAFIGDPNAESVFKAPTDPDTDPGIQLSPYQYPVEKTFVESVHRQQMLLIDARDQQSRGLHKDNLRYISGHLQNLEALTRSLGSRKRDRAPFLVEDEYDLQDLLTGVLRLFDEDTEPEDTTPKMAGTSSRADWIMRTLEIAVEAKFCRSTDSRRKVRDELTTDLSAYSAHPKAKAFLAVVYDPERTIDNPAGFIRDLEEHGNQFIPTTILIVPRR